MRLRLPNVLLAACAAALANEPAHAQGSATSPMERLALLAEGSWVGEGGGTRVRLRYEWGAGKRSLRTVGSASGRAFAPGLATSEFTFESLCYWHPTEQKYRLLSASHDGSLSDGWLVIDDRVWDWRVDKFAPDGGATKFVTRWVWQGEDAFTSSLFEQVDGEFRELGSVEFRRTKGESEQAGAEGSAGDLGGARAVPTPLGPLIRLAGHTWEVDESWEDGRVFKNRQVYAWSVNNRALWSHTWAIRPQSTEHVYDALYYWHPGQRTLRMVVIGAAGDSYEGTVEAERNTLILKYDALGAAPLEFLEHLDFPSAERFTSTLWDRSRSPRRKPMLEVTYVRRDEPGGDTERDEDK